MANVFFRQSLNYILVLLIQSVSMLCFNVLTSVRTLTWMLYYSRCVLINDRSFFIIDEKYNVMFLKTWSKEIPLCHWCFGSIRHISSNSTSNKSDNIFMRGFNLKICASFYAFWFNGVVYKKGIFDNSEILT